MTKTGVRLDDIGPAFTWCDLRDFVVNLPPTADSALYRVQHPKSWWWTPDHDFLSAVITSLQWANWQRGGGKGPKPAPIKRPKDKRVTRNKVDPQSAQDLAARRAALKQRMEGGAAVGD